MSRTFPSLTVRESNRFSCDRKGDRRAYSSAWRASAIMRSMSLPNRHEELLEATEHLPDGATLVVHEFDWEDYERLLQTLEDRPHLRVSYDSGRLEILSPSSSHEQYGAFMDLVVFVFCEVRGLK